MMSMDLDAFRSSLDQAIPPEGLSLPVQALWWDGKGNWDKAHECAQADSGPLAAVFQKVGGLRLEVGEDLLDGRSQTAAAGRRIAGLDGNRNFHHHAHWDRPSLGLGRLYRFS